MKKEKGSCNFALIVFAFFLLFLSLTVYHIYIRTAQSVKLRSDDAAILSTLSANVADVYEYASSSILALDTTGHIGYGDYNSVEEFKEGSKSAYVIAKQRFENALNINFKATKVSGNTYKSNLPYLSTIKVNEFKVYNVRYNDVYENSGGETIMYNNQAGVMRTETGKVLSCSGVYADITLTIHGIGPFGDFEMPMKEFVDLSENE